MTHQGLVGVGALVFTPRERELVCRAMASNRLSYGPMSRQFEAQVAELHGCAFGVFCSSGTAALHLALAALSELEHWAPGDEVIVPAVTFIATLNVVHMMGLNPVLADVQADTFNIDPLDVERKITSRTRCIIPVHLLGLPADMDEILSLARKHGLRVAEDSCQSMFAQYRGRPVGSMSDAGCFSTSIGHVITTGVGGMVVSNRQDLVEIMRSLSWHGRDPGRAVAADDGPSSGEVALAETIRQQTQFVRKGFSYRITEIEAAIGLGQLESRQEFLERRQQIASAYREVLLPYQAQISCQVVPSDRTHCYMAFGCLCKNAALAEAMVRHLTSRNIETRPLYPLVTQPAYRRASSGDVPVASSLADRSFYFGCHPYITDSEVDYVCGSIEKFLVGGDGP